MICCVGGCGRWVNIGEIHEDASYSWPFCEECYEERFKDDEDYWEQKMDPDRWKK